MEFRSYLEKLLPNSEFDAVWASFFEPKNVGFFCNLLKMPKILLENELKILGIKWAEILPNFYAAKPEFREILTKSAIFNEGKIYIQNPSSFLAALALNAQKNDEILEMCASPGGKSIALANFVGTNAKISAIEANKERFFTLKKNLKKYGCDPIKTFNKDARSIARTCYERFDKILLDAPCSAYSLFGENFQEKSPKEIKQISRLQKQLLNSALNALKIGGEVVYSTCTFFEEENEQVIKNALNSKFKVQIVPLNLPKNPANIQNSDFGTRILPDENFNAFFIAKLKKLG